MSISVCVCVCVCVCVSLTCLHALRRRRAVQLQSPPVPSSPSVPPAAHLRGWGTADAFPSAGRTLHGHSVVSPFCQPPEGTEQRRDSGCDRAKDSLSLDPRPPSQEHTHAHTRTQTHPLTNTLTHTVPLSFFSVLQEKTKYICKELGMKDKRCRRQRDCLAVM